MIDNLSDYTDEELTNELKRREEERKKPKIPQPIGGQVIHTGDLLAACKQYIENIAKGEYDEDDQHYIFEAALVMLYGNDIWIWVNGRHDK